MTIQNKDKINNEIFKILDADKSINYISFLCTPWHALSFEAAKYFIEYNERVELKGLTVIKKHKATGYSLVVDDFNGVSEYCCYGLGDDAVITQKEKLYSILQLRKSLDKKNFYIFVPHRINLTWIALLSKYYSDRNIFCVIIDEGLATYFEDNKGWIKEIIRNDSIGIIGRIKLYINRYLVSDICKNRISRAGLLINCNLLKESKNILKPNEKMMQWYREAISKSNSRKGLSELQMPSKYILINTQLFDGGEADASNFEILEKCIEIIRKNGYDVFLKAHPRDNNKDRYKQLNVKMLDYGNITQESMLELMNHKPAYILSYYSTTLITSKLFFGIEPISIAEIFLEVNALSKVDKRRLERFLQIFNKMIVHVKTYLELDVLISSNRRRKF